jgi:hypothetical protein
VVQVLRQTLLPCLIRAPSTWFYKKGKHKKFSKMKKEKEKMPHLLPATTPPASILTTLLHLHPSVQKQHTPTEVPPCKANALHCSIHCNNTSISRSPVECEAARNVLPAVPAVVRHEL